MYFTISSSHQIRFNETRNIIREPVDSEYFQDDLKLGYKIFMPGVELLSTHICPDCFVKKEKNSALVHIGHDL